MRTIRHTSRFKRDYKRERSGRYGRRLDADLLGAVTMLANDEVLPWRYFDHQLGGDWQDHRDCHIRPDLILVYRKPDDASLELVRLGSHSELGL
jgi:mRNA interferase YafQ